MSEAQSPPDLDPPDLTDDTEAAEKAAKNHWLTKREKILRQHDLWETWGCVPYITEREKPIDAYLPGGREYDPSEVADD